MLTRILLNALFPFMVLALTGCSAGEAQDSPAAIPPPGVTTASVSVRAVRDWADFTGRLEAIESVEIRARVAGFVESVHFKEGSRVATDDLLFQIDPRPFKAEVDRLSAELVRARAELKLARSFADRAERLLARNATSQEEFERFVADAAVAEARLAAVQATLDSAELELSFTRVTAPISGRVSRAMVTAGNLVDSATLLTTLVADDAIYVYFDVDEQTYLEHLELGTDAEETFAYIGLINEADYPHVAKLDFVDNQVDPDHGTIRARAVLPNPDGRFTPGLFARVRLVGRQYYEAALIDDRAIGTDLDRKFVLVVDEQNVAQYRAVETGRLVDGLRVVKSGLALGDVVIVNGLQRVRPGSAVTPNEVALETDSRLLANFGSDADARSSASDQ